MKKISLFYTSILAFMLSSCGGGGGGGGASPAPEIPLAIINFSSSLSGEIDVGTEFTFSWTTTNASSCSSSGDWNQAVGTSGSYTITLNEAKNYVFTLSCINSAGRSSSQNISITANYLLVGGSIFHDDNENKTVFIDQNHNRLLDSFEYSTTSDSGGNYQIRSFDNIECLKDYTVAIDNSHLFAINQIENKEQVNISPFTSLFRSFTWSGLDPLKSELYNSENPCNLMDSRERARTEQSFNRALELQENITGYTYEEIQQNPLNSSKQAITSQRFDDLESFYSSLDQVANDVETVVNSLIDDAGTGTGISSNDYEIRTAIDLDYSNLVIFLNESNYPTSLTDENDSDFQANSVDKIALRADIMIEIDPGTNVTMSNLNGWDESFTIHLSPIFVTNNNDLVRDNYNCYVNPSNYCFLDIASDLFGDEMAVNDYSNYYTLQKETSIGLQRIETSEDIDVSADVCDVYKSYRITNTIDYSSSDEFYTVDSYHNRISDYGLYNTYDESSPCDTAFVYPTYKWMQSAKIYNDNTIVILSWDNPNIDSLLNVSGVLEFNQDNLPPDQIEGEVIDEFLNQPNISSYKNNDFTLTYESIDALRNEIISYINDADNFGYQWIEYFIRNQNNGTAALVLERQGSYYYQYYINCYWNGSDIFTNYYFSSSVDYYVYECLSFTDGNDDFIFSRSSKHNRDNSGNTISPYNGVVQIPTENVQSSARTSYNNNPKSNMDIKNLTDEEIAWKMKNKAQSAASTSKW
jgi:hypothetical protein